VKSYRISSERLQSITVRYAYIIHTFETRANRGEAECSRKVNVDD